MGREVWPGRFTAFARQVCSVSPNPMLVCTLANPREAKRVLHNIARPSTDVDSFGTTERL